MDIRGQTEEHGVRRIEFTIPLLYLQQWDDELFPRADGLKLFDLFGSELKTMHANPGGHLGLPRAELEDMIVFFRRHLGRAEP